MPVYIFLSNLIITKKAVIEKYAGGLEQFRKDYKIPEWEVNHEDDELFSLSKMNADEFDIERLMSKGLSFDIDAQKSEDFTILNRYGGEFWEVPWLENNRVFAWHTNTSSACKARMEEICNMTMDAIMEKNDKGNNLFRTIRMEGLVDGEW